MNVKIYLYNDYLIEHAVNHRKKHGLRQYFAFAAFLSCEEWGDKSQITAIALAANYNSLSVILGGSLAYIACIFIALVLGTLVQKVLNERALNIIGGILFIGFAVYMLIFSIILRDDE